MGCRPRLSSYSLPSRLTDTRVETAFLPYQQLSIERLAPNAWPKKTNTTGSPLETLQTLDYWLISSGPAEPN